ncbi:hypothetical protein [Ferrimonas balearica]|uniref:hypothetical protein n=1 Tax=Ferrimonas balearica TaxID=44012 RepID=UPI001C99CC84|nr:hypothetical protein [Ferrimonas balearica]MBY5992182.1 hypothetical protein [Ferrimonas balearica]
MSIVSKEFTLADSGPSRFQLDPSGFLFVELADRELSAPLSQLDFTPQGPGQTRLSRESGEAEPLWQLVLADEDAGYLLRLIGREG